MGVHAGRSVLEEAKRFSNEGKVVGEYVKNSWQYTDNPPTVEVFVNHDEKSIRIKDNSNGMSKEIIEDQFLVLHQENLERKLGKKGRGEYGTGKVAALGIGEALRVRTVKDGFLNEFEIHRKDCEANISLDGVKVRWTHSNIKTTEANGTIITIVDFNLNRKINTRQIKDYLQSKTLTEKIYKHPIKLSLDAEELKVKEIPFVKEFTGGEFEPNESQFKSFGKSDLRIKVASRELEVDERGISVFCDGIFKAFIKNPNAPKNQFIFGEVECPKLADESLVPPVFDSSRREELNQDQPVADDFFKYISICVDKVRKILEKESNDRKQKERDEILKKESEKMKDFFNQDFKQHNLEFQKRIAKVRGDLDYKEDVAPELGETKIVIGKDFAVNIEEGNQGAGIHDRHNDGEGGDNENPSSNGKLNPTDELSNNYGKKSDLKKKRSMSGGFNFEWDNLGVEDKRAKYDDVTRTITINLDHPLISRIDKMVSGQRGSSAFLRASYEAAIFEYAVAIAIKKSQSSLCDDTLDEGVLQMQELVDNLLKKMANLSLFND